LKGGFEYPGEVLDAYRGWQRVSVDGADTRCDSTIETRRETVHKSGSTIGWRADAIPLNLSLSVLDFRYPGISFATSMSPTIEMLRMKRFPDEIVANKSKESRCQQHEDHTAKADDQRGSKNMVAEGGNTPLLYRKSFRRARARGQSNLTRCNTQLYHLVEYPHTLSRIPCTTSTVRGDW